MAIWKRPRTSGQILAGHNSAHAHLFYVWFIGLGSQPLARIGSQQFASWHGYFEYCSLIGICLAALLFVGEGQYLRFFRVQARITPAPAVVHCRPTAHFTAWFDQLGVVAQQWRRTTGSSANVLRCPLPISKGMDPGAVCAMHTGAGATRFFWAKSSQPRICQRQRPTVHD